MKASNRGSLFMKGETNMSKNTTRKDDKGRVLYTGESQKNGRYLYKYKDIMKTLNRMASNEGRCAFFKVKMFEKKKFEKLFNLYFSDYFTFSHSSNTFRQFF